MNRLLFKIKSKLARYFFWLDSSKQSVEFRPERTHDHALVLQTTQRKKLPGLRQLRYIGKVLSTKELKLIFSAAVILIIGFVTGFFSLSKNHLLVAPAEGGTVTEAAIGSPKHINPLFSETNDPDADLVSLIYSGLFKRVDGKLIPDLVEKYEWFDDGRKLRIDLRKDVFFHDGTPLTSDDVIFTLRTAKDPSWRSTYVKTFENALFERIDDHALNINLKNPDVFILDALTIGILPSHIWQSIHPGNALLAEANTKPVGSGPFKIRSLRRNTNGVILAYTLERYDRFYGIKPFIDQLTIRYYPDRIQAEDALRGGQVDVYSFVAPDGIADLTKNERLHVSTLELPQETIAFFNLKDDVLKDEQIRQALQYATNRDAVIESQAGIAKPVYGPYPFEEIDLVASSTEERLDEARKLLDEAGWVQAEGSDIRILKSTAESASGTTIVANASSTEFELTITVPDVPDLKAVADALARQWSILGIKIVLAVESTDSLMKRILEKNDAQILVWNVLLNPSQDLYPLWWSGETEAGGLNLSNLADRNVDDALDALKDAGTSEELKEGRKKLSDAILARVPAVFLTRPAYGLIYHKKIQGIAPSLKLGKPSDRYQDIANWYLKTSWRWK